VSSADTDRKCTKGGAQPCRSPASGVPRGQWCCICHGYKECAHAECRRPWRSATDADRCTLCGIGRVTDPLCRDRRCMPRVEELRPTALIAPMVRTGVESVIFGGVIPAELTADDVAWLSRFGKRVKGAANAVRDAHADRIAKLESELAATRELGVGIYDRLLRLCSGCAMVARNPGEDYQCMVHPDDRPVVAIVEGTDRRSAAIEAALLKAAQEL